MPTYSENFIASAAADIAHAHVVMTMVGGKIVYEGNSPVLRSV